jgi:phenylalanyl-tRNA synthetase alpha chain
MPPASKNLEALEAEAREAIGAAATLQALTQVRARFLGRKGSVSEFLRGIGDLDTAERSRAGQAANDAKRRIEQWVAERREALEKTARRHSLEAHGVDVTLPGAGLPSGHLHPITHVTRSMVRFFTSLGFSVEEGPEVETDYYNFEALNIPADHPARDFIAPGRVYRHDLSPKHSPMFHQIEGFLVDERVTFGDLKGVLYAFARHLMGEAVELRFRANHFPFTEPSAELDLRSAGEWLEWGGCGMIHPHVLDRCGIDSDRYQGFAFGMGIDRTAMHRFGIPHLRLLFESDVRVLEQF